jgi:hypothetical protein
VQAHLHTHTHTHTHTKQLEGQLGQLHAANLLGSLQVMMEAVVGDMLGLAQQQPDANERVRVVAAAAAVVVVVVVVVVAAAAVVVVVVVPQARAACC